MKVLLIDDHPLILSALKAVVQGFGENVEVKGVETAAAARTSLAADADFDLALLDLQLGDADGFELLGELRNTYPALPIVVVSASDRTSDVIRSIDMGAMGFVPKRASNETLLEALRLVMSGGIYVPPMSMDSTGGTTNPRPMNPSLASHAVGHHASQGGFQKPPTLAGLGLTPRQTDVLALLLQGKPNKLIARDLNVSVETVKDHVAAVLRALNVSTRTQAVLAVGQMQQQSGGSLPSWQRPAR
ncbi:MAG TPA: response regulator transcription factor [Methylibium sp.]|uniref:response regulator transcription factor n=1 Tax=Methylibium sp. TaxID=2067992 RepID=UPI002DB5BEA9|nr:response regulator transcription factor [Methylibium sp.]HEU4459817.1 response regulator transcription factor [Methylibium sp.]